MQLPYKCLLFLSMFLTAYTLQAQWISRKPLSIARQEMPAVLNGRNIYVTGGISLLGITISDMEIYNIDTDKWSAGPAMPQPRHHHAMAIWEGKIYVIGGYKDVLFKPRPEMYVFDISSGRWSTGTPLPEALGAGDAVAWEGKIYFFGGTDGDNTSRSVYIFDITANTWSRGADMPTAREHLAAEVIEGLFYVVAGRGADFASTRLEIYDPITDSWDAGIDLPTARSGLDAVALNGVLHVFGGEGDGIHGEHEVYDPANDTWETFPPLPNARHGLAAVTSGDTIFTIAGATLEGYGPSKLNEAYIVDTPTNIHFGNSVLRSLTANYQRSTGTLSVFSDFPAGTNLEARLFSTDGRELLRSTKLLGAGKNTWSINYPGLPPGVYLLQISTSMGRQFIKLSNL